MLRSSWICATPLVAVLCLGCGGGDGPERGNVRGSVSFKGTPVEKGTITFTPTGETKGPLSSTTIEKGEYEFTDKPPVLGTHAVSILAYVDKGTNASGSPESEQIIPKTFNENTTLEVEVTDEAKPHDFDLNP